MKSIIKLGLIGAVLFGAAFAGSSYFLVKKPEPVAEAPNEEVPEGEPKVAGSKSSTKEQGFSAIADSHGEKKTASGPIEKVDSMPVSLHPEQPLSIEAVLQLSESIRKKEAQLNEREKMVSRDEQRVKLMFDDVAREQKELEALGDSLDGRISAARELLARIQQERAGNVVDSKESGKPAAGTTPNKAGGSPLSDLDQEVEAAKTLFSALDPDQAAMVIKQFSNSGKLDFAARLLNTMEKRQQTGILTALNDPVLGAQLVESITKAER